MTDAFELEKNKKAFAYTAIICAIVLLLFFIIHWTVEEPSIPVVQDLIEINLGNDMEGFGEEQPLIKGERNSNPTENTAPTPAPAAASDDAVEPEDKAPEEAAPVTKPVKNVPKTKVPTPVKTETPTTPKPQKPKITYQGPGNGNGNNATEDNGYRYQGNNPNGKGDNGSSSGNKDSYGNSPGGRVGGPKVTRGNRKIVHYYTFSGDLNKATIFAIIKVSPEGKGNFVGFDKGSTSRSQAYADAISGYLRTMQFDKADDESVVTVQFNFNVQ